jgi:2-C-methyl-D-erythritol 4-phosphate cytidylyltransferase
MSLALILAAGSGERLGAQVPKALVQLGGRSLLQWSVDAISAVPGVQEIVLALPAGVAAPQGLKSVTGGAVRSESVRRALSASSHAGPVLVHDAARPLVTPTLAQSVLDALQADAGADGAIAAVPVTDTVKRAREGTAEVAETLPRNALWSVQTPQVFRRAALERALDVDDEVLAAATDDAWLVERSGGRVILVRSSVQNIKVTTPLDLRLAELLAAGTRSGAP